MHLNKLILSLVHLFVTPPGTTVYFTYFQHSRNIQTGVCAITCFLHACRHQNGGRSRKYIAKVLWLLTYDDDKSTLAEAVDKYCVGVPHITWLPW